MAKLEIQKHRRRRMKIQMLGMKRRSLQTIQHLQLG
jgi:hypothetical protein